MNMLMKSIKSKITFIVVLIVCSAFGVFALLDYQQLRQSAFYNLEQLADRKINRLALNIALPLWEIDNKWLEKILASEMADEQVYAI